MECLEQTGFVFQQLGNGYTMLKKAALAKCDFVLTEVKRQVGRWMLRSLAARENGVYSAAAELRIYVGQLARGTPSKGLRCVCRKNFSSKAALRSDRVALRLLIAQKSSTQFRAEEFLFTSSFVF